MTKKPYILLLCKWTGPVTLLAGLLCVVSASDANAQPPSYIVTNLGTLGGSYSAAVDLNSSGHVVGSSTTAGGDVHAFLYDGVTMHDLGTLGGTTSGASSINDDGLITGSSPPTGSQPHRAFIYDGSMHALGTLGGFSSTGNGINASGQVAGVSLLPGDSFLRAFRYDGTTMYDLGTLGGTDSIAYGINDDGWVTGYSSTIEGQRAFLYDGTMMHDLGTLGGGGSVGSAINANGHLTGYSITIDGNAHAFFYDGTTMHDLGTLGGESSQGFGINARSEVVGISMFEIDNSDSHAFVYTSDDGMVDLNSLIDPALGWELRSANAINNVGQITGWGLWDGQQRAFLLTPVPEPTSGALWLSGVLILAATRRRLRKARRSRSVASTIRNY